MPGAEEERKSGDTEMRKISDSICPHPPTQLKMKRGVNFNKGTWRWMRLVKIQILSLDSNRDEPNLPGIGLRQVWQTLLKFRYRL